MTTPGSTKYAYISADEVDEYRENGLAEDRIRAMNEKRRQRAEDLLRGYNPEEFPYITKEHYEQQVAQGATRSKLESLNKQLGEELRRFRSNMTLVPQSSNTAHQSRDPVSEMDLRIVLFGLSGEGLSATGDTILGRSLSKSAEYEIHEDDRKITVLKISFSEYDIDNLGKWVEETTDVPRVDAFLLIVNISNHRDLKTQAKLWQNIKTYNEDIVVRCILVLTHADLSFRGGDSLSNIYANYVDEKNGVPFGAVMRDLYPRIVALNNLSQSQQEMHVQQDQIMLMINAVSQEMAPSQITAPPTHSPPPTLGKTNGTISPGEEPPSQADWEMQNPTEEKPPSQTDEVLPSPAERGRSFMSQDKTQAEGETQRDETQGDEGAQSENADGDGSTGEVLQQPHENTSSRVSAMSGTPSCPSRAAKRKSACKTSSVDDAFMRYVGSRTESRDDDSCEHLFEKMVTASLLEFSRRNRAIAKLRIQQVLYEMEVL